MYDKELGFIALELTPDEIYKALEQYPNLKRYAVIYKSRIIDDNLSIQFYVSWDKTSRWEFNPDDTKRFMKQMNSENEDDLAGKVIGIYGLYEPGRTLGVYIDEKVSNGALDVKEP